MQNNWLASKHDEKRTVPGKVDAPHFFQEVGGFAHKTSSVGLAIGSSLWDKIEEIYSERYYIAVMCSCG